MSDTYYDIVVANNAAALDEVDKDDDHAATDHDHDGTYVSLAERDWTLPTGAVAQTFERNIAGTNLTMLATGRLSFQAVWLNAGDVVDDISYFSGATPLNVGSNQWFCLYSSARAKLAVTADDTSTAWAANTKKTLTLTAPYTVLTSGLYYVGICVVATTPPTLRGQAGFNAAMNAVAPILAGSSDSGLTDPASAPATAAALTAQAETAYAYLA